MRVVSLVPSWTETLLKAGVEVVGRTRYCIHPAERVKNIAIVGGTKNWDLPALEALRPDLLILDQEENPKWMSEQGLPFVATHVTSVATMPESLELLATHLNNPVLSEYARRWEMVARPVAQWRPEDSLPGLLEWGRRPTEEIRHIVYVIWRSPWMAVAESTFVGSMLSQVGLGAYLTPFKDKYPQFEMRDFDRADTLLLFSSEPYPFLAKKAELVDIKAPYAFVNGECFSWFGLRSLTFLENLQTGSNP